MKNHYILLTIVLFVSITAFSQVRIGDFNPSMYSFNKLKKKSISRFKEQTTKFILPDFYTKEEYENMLKESWDVTPYEIILLKDFDDSRVIEGDVLAQFVSRYYKRPGGTGGFSTYRYFCVLDFMVIDEIKKKPRISQLKWDGPRIGTIYFTKGSGADLDLPFSLMYYKEESGFFPPVEKLEYLANFRLGYLKNYLQLANKLIKNEKSLDLYEDFVDPQLRELKDKTLYIDKTFFRNDLDAPVNKKLESITDLMKKYSYEYKFVDYENIEEVINDKSNTSNFYYLMCNQISFTKILSIINGKTGDIVYQYKKYSSSSFREKDITKLNSAIKKLNK